MFCFALRAISLSHIIDFCLLWEMSSKKKLKRLCPFSSAKKAPKQKTSQVLSKKWAGALAASDKGSYFEQDKLLLSMLEEPSLYRSTGNYFSHVLRSFLPTPEKCAELYFALFLKTKIASNQAHICSLLAAIFHPFSLKFARNVDR